MKGWVCTTVGVLAQQPQATGLVTILHKTRSGGHTSHPSTPEGEARGEEVQGQT